MYNFLKKSWCLLFTNKPYKIVSFKRLLHTSIGQPIDVPESLTAILLTETGVSFNYRMWPKSLNHDFIPRALNDKPRFIEKGIFKEPDRQAYSLSNGCLFGSLGLVYDMETRSVINESAQEWLINLKHSVYTNLINYPPKIRLKGIVLSCVTNGADYGFYHFLFESLVKLHFYKPFIDQAEHILFNGPAFDWKLKWLKRVDINIDKVIWVTNVSHYECDQLVFSNKLVSDQQISNWCINGLKKILNINTKNKTNQSTKKIIWISRKGLHNRAIDWEDELLSCFLKITRVDLTALGDVETIETMANASHIIAPHGAGLCNIYLCQPGTKILELYPDTGLYQPCYNRIADICKLEYHIAFLNFKNKLNDERGLDAFKNILSNFLC